MQTIDPQEMVVTQSSSSTLRQHFRRQVPLAYVPSVKKFPKQYLDSLKNVTLSTAFYKWYNEELFNCDLKSDEERKLSRKVAYIVKAMMYCLPADVIIPDKPTELVAFEQWAEKLQQYADIAQKKILDICM